MSWRLKWALNELCDVSHADAHRHTLHSWWKYWFAIVAKFLPGLWPFAIRMHLKSGGSFLFTEFMTLFIYKEIVIDKCYDDPALLVEDPIIIDVGANIGLFAIRMKQLYPRSTIYCYEPMPFNYAQLQVKVSFRVAICIMLEWEAAPEEPSCFSITKAAAATVFMQVRRAAEARLKLNSSMFRRYLISSSTGVVIC